MLTFSDRFDPMRASCKREQGQTMAEYAVALAVITVATVTVFELLAGGISGSINKVIALLP